MVQKAFAWPLRTGPRGYLKEVTGKQATEQALQMVLDGVPAGTIPYRGTQGFNAYRLIFADSGRLRGAVPRMFATAVARSYPEIRILSVDVTDVETKKGTVTFLDVAWEDGGEAEFSRLTVPYAAPEG